MIRWCCYCQSFMGQIAPFNDFSVSHGICPACAKKWRDGKSLTFDPKIKDFYNVLFGQIQASEPVDIKHLMSRAKELGLKDYELLIGVLHPLLWRIGAYFEQGKLSVAQEQLFSTEVKNIVAKLQLAKDESKVTAQTDGKANDNADVLIIVADDSEHFIGANFISLLLVEKLDIRCATISEAPTTPQQLALLLAKHQPAIVGISISLPSHIDYVFKVQEWLKLHRPIQLMVGGPASMTVSDYSDVIDPTILTHIGNPYDVQASCDFIEGLCHPAQSQRTAAS